MDIRLFPPCPCMGRLFDIRQSDNTARPLKRRRQIVWIAASLEPPAVKVKAAGGRFRRLLSPKFASALRRLLFGIARDDLGEAAEELVRHLLGGGIDQSAADLRQFSADRRRYRISQHGDRKSTRLNSSH